MQTQTWMSDYKLLKSQLSVLQFRKFIFFLFLVSAVLHTM